jgi:outer membrane protein
MAKAAPLSLEDAIAVALKQNPRWLAGQREVDVARAQVGVASATLYPNVNLNSQMSRSQNAGGGGNNNNNLLNAASGSGLSQVSLNVQQILLDFGRRAENIKAAEKLAQSSAYQAEALRQDVVLEVRQRYYQAHTDHQTVAIQQGVVKNSQRHLLETQGFYRAGLQPLNEVTKAEADLAQAQLDLVLAQTALEQDWVLLNQSLGRSSVEAYELTVVSTERSNFDPPLDRLVDLAYAFRPEARQIAAQIEAATARMEAAYRNRYPTLSANAQTGYRGVNGPLEEFWSVGLNLSFNLFNGFQDRFQAEGFRAQAEALTASLAATRQQVYSDTSRAQISLKNARAAIEAAGVNVRSSQSNFQLARRRYETGLGSNLEYQDAQLLLARAQIGQVQALNRYHLALAEMLRAVGVDDFLTFYDLIETFREDD